MVDCHLLSFMQFLLKTLLIFKRLFILFCVKIA